ncbi:MAG: PH domain-containing protein, partial [Pyrinomonadaceae bacterium]
AATDPEVTRVARSTALAENEDKALEQVVFSIRPTLMFVVIGYAAAAVGGLVLVALLGLLSSMIANWIPLFVAVPLGFSLLLIPAYYHFKRNMIHYTLTDSKIQFDEGFIWRKTRSIPLRTIQDVTVSTGVFQRLLGFGSVVIDNASESNSNIVMHNISKPQHYADLLLHEMRDH